MWPEIASRPVPTPHQFAKLARNTLRSGRSHDWLISAQPNNSIFLFWFIPTPTTKPLTSPKLAHASGAEIFKFSRTRRFYLAIAHVVFVEAAGSSVNTRTPAISCRRTKQVIYDSRQVIIVVLKPWCRQFLKLEKANEVYETRSVGGRYADDTAE